MTLRPSGAAVMVALLSCDEFEQHLVRDVLLLGTSVSVDKVVPAPSTVPAAASIGSHPVGIPRYECSNPFLPLQPATWSRGFTVWSAGHTRLP